MDPPQVSLTRPKASVVICAYTLDRWHQLEGAVDSVIAQDHPVSEVLVVIDHNEILEAKARGRWDLPVRVLPSRGRPGLSGARNTGLLEAVGEIVVFLDDDATARPGWLSRLVAGYADPLVAAVGGAARPMTAGPRPGWWPVEFDWVVGCSHPGMPSEPREVRNLVGANMSVRRTLALQLGGFSEDMGRVGVTPLGCEETDLFIRLAKRWPDARVLYDPRAEVDHHVPDHRLSWDYFRSRCLAEGRSKALVASRNGASHALSEERTYTRQVLPAGAGRAVKEALSGNLAAFGRAAAIAAGLLMTTLGYMRGRFDHLIPLPVRAR